MLFAHDAFQLSHPRRLALEFRHDAAIRPVLDEASDAQGFGPASHELPEPHALYFSDYPEPHADACHAAAPPGP